MATLSSSVCDNNDCPICLERLTLSEQDVYVMPCTSCDYNFCSNCVSDFVKASQSDFEVASDGSRQVKIHIGCPQCRSKYPMDITDVLLLRKAHSLAVHVYQSSSRSGGGGGGGLIEDSELTATQLSLKNHFFHSAKRRRAVLQAHVLYAKVLANIKVNDGKPRVAPNKLETALEQCTRLMEGLDKTSKQNNNNAQHHHDDDEDDDDDHDDSDEDYETTTAQQQQQQYPQQRQLVKKKKKQAPLIDDTLFQGLEDCMGKDEKLFLTQLMISGNVRQVSQAAMIMHGILKLSMDSATFRLNNQLNMGKNGQKNANLMEQTKQQFPLCNHMPGYFIIPAFDESEQFLQLEDLEWDGSIIFRSQRVFDNVYAKHYQDNNIPTGVLGKRKVVIIKAVRGPAGRVGLRRADVVTHINDVEWEGTAQELEDYIYSLKQQHFNDDLTLTVNANPETAQFLKIRAELMMQKQQQQSSSNRSLKSNSSLKSNGSS